MMVQSDLFFLLGLKTDLDLLKSVTICLRSLCASSSDIILWKFSSFLIIFFSSLKIERIIETLASALVFLTFPLAGRPLLLLAWIGAESS